MAQPADGQPNAASASAPLKRVQSATVRALPGGLNNVPVLNSNSPEVVQSDGILVSALPPAGMATPEAHLNHPFSGRFDVFLHHIARGVNADDQRTLYVAIVLANKGSRPVHVNVLQAASYLSQPDAPFIEKPSCEENSSGTIFAGPGDRVALECLRGLRQAGWTDRLTVPPRQTTVLYAVPIPVQGLTPPLNGRSALAMLRSDGPIYAATLAMYGKQNADGGERAPSASEWSDLLTKGALAGPREREASAPGAPGAFTYGRVAGIARGDEWQAKVANCSTGFNVADLSGTTTAYPISTVERGTFGTGQIQSAPLLVREPGTAYAAHGNYGVLYALDIPFVNTGTTTKSVTVSLDTPLKDDAKSAQLTFYQQPSPRVFFRGSVRLRYEDESGKSIDRLVHLVEHQGEQGCELVKVALGPNSHRKLRLSFIYPPDATPPQVVSIRVTEQ